MSKSAALQKLYDDYFESLKRGSKPEELSEIGDLDEHESVESAKTRTVIIYEEESEEKGEKMFEIKGSETSKSRLVSVKGSGGYSLMVQSPVWTPFGIQKVESVKNLTHEEAMALRDDLNKHYPVNYLDVISAEFVEVP